MTEQTKEEIALKQVEENSAELNLLVQQLQMEPSDFFELARWDEFIAGDNITPVLCAMARAFITINSLTAQNEYHAVETTDLLGKIENLELRLELLNAPKDTSGENKMPNEIVRNSD